MSAAVDYWYWPTFPNQKRRLSPSHKHTRLTKYTMNATMDVITMRTDAIITLDGQSNPSKRLDDSHGTNATAPDIDIDDSYDTNEVKMTGAPIIICEDDADLRVANEARMECAPIAICEDDADLLVPAPTIICEDDADLPVQDPPKIPPARIHVKHAKETHWHTSRIKDTIRVQGHHTVNDDEVHEENPHLEDFLIPHHSVHVEPAENILCSAQRESTRGSILHAHTVATPKRKVHFGEVLVRDYEMILGDHPCCSYGPPVTIDWDYLEYEPLDVNEYEFHHPPRRNIKEMGLNYYKRMALLSKAGFTEVEFKQSKKLVKREKTNRSITKSIVRAFPLMKLEDAVESSCRKLKRLIKEDHWKQQKSQFIK